MEGHEADRARLLAAQLPRPDARYAAGDATFEVYRAKGTCPRWSDLVLQKLVLFARNSYLRYGDRPTLDRYDMKAAIYLVRASYPNPDDPGRILEEWLSIRMAPGHGTPVGGGEIELYSYQGKRLDQWVRESFPGKGESFWEYVVSSSRMCGIRPYPQRGEGRQDDASKPRHRHTAICFALIHAQFLIDYPLATYPYEYVTAIIREELLHKSLRIVKDGQVFEPTFTPAYQFFGLPGRTEIKLDRAVYAYKFPSYWFDVPRLVALLEGLVKEEKLDPSSIKRYLNVELSSAAGLKELGRLLTVKGRIVGSRLTGDELRAMVDDCVRDIPELKITKTADWNQGFLGVLKAAGVDIFSQHPWLEDHL